MIELEKMPKLGFGLMRLPKKDGAEDFEQVCEMIDAYMKNGFNYFDTAYVYDGGDSEKIVKRALVERFPRESFMLATKLPAWEMHCKEDRDRIFNEQLERTGAGYFDFYLMHSVEDGSNGEKYEEYDCYNWAMKKKEEGLIKHLGFSFHGSPEYLVKVLDAHPEVEFVQIQLNYVDWSNPVIRAGELYEILTERKIPIIVMEPVRGGFLADPVDRVKELYKEEFPGKSCASVALRYVASLDGVMTVLSGMSTVMHMNDNISTFSPFVKLNDKEKEAVEKAVAIFKDIDVIPCTGCKYCCEGCPMNIPISDVFSAVNSIRLYNDNFRARMFYGGKTTGRGKAKDCISCGQCEGVCPQHLPIIKLMAEASKQLDV